MFIDADEYLVINPVDKGDRKDLFQKQSNSTYKAIHVTPRKYINMKKNFGHPIPKEPNTAAKIFNEKIQARTRLPSVINKMTISKFIKMERLKQPWSSNSCIVFPRITFGNTEETNKTLLYQNIPKLFDPFKFNTLRFFRYDYKGFKDIALSPGKSLVDISRLSNHTLTRNMTLCMHSIVKECGIGPNNAIVMLEDSLLKIHHYSMPKEAFFAKSDKKRNIEIYKERATFNKSVSYFIRPWLDSFVKDVGVNAALNLLKGSGEIGNWKHPDDASNFVGDN